MNEFAELREKLGWTCSRIALKVGRHQTTVFRWNTGFLKCPAWALEIMRELVEKKNYNETRK
jgi:DNA-binding XRE family transcriptional regulator